MQFFIEPNELDGGMLGFGELIIKLPIHQEEALWSVPGEPPRQINLFFVAGFVTILFLIKMFELMDYYPEELNLMGRFLDELYGHSEEDLCLEDLLGEQPAPVAPAPAPYEDKYKETYSKLTLHELTKEELDGLANNSVMEYTPVGNVIMTYNVVKGSFEYYSDSIVPYRYLNVVGRKYACTFNCASLMTKGKEQVVEKMLLENAAQELVTTPASASEETKKSVFAKFKTYNKGAPNLSMQAGADQSNKRGRIDPSKVMETNRYTSCGKIANMQMLKKVDRKQVDKTYAMSFAEYKQKMAESKCS
jgi:hypothetical protein